MEAALTSTITVALAEIGDKTQLLSLFLATRFANHWAIVLGILVATLLNHGASAWLGDWIIQIVPAEIAKWIVAVSFIAIALWVLIPDKEDGASHVLDRYGAFVATTILFFLAEVGDKTQVATVVLAAQYQSIVVVTLGTTIGMMIANVPVVIVGEQLMRRLPLDYARYGAAFVFLLLGLVTLIL